MYAVRSDLLSAEKCAELSRLMQRATTLTGAQFDERWNEVEPANFIDSVAKFTKDPIAAASLGQVHRARLRDGAEVVVKLAKRDVRGEFHGDLHPGNVIWKDDKFWFLDNANVETVPGKFARALFKMLVLLGEGRAGEAATKLARSSIEPLSLAAARMFQSQFIQLYRGVTGKSVAQASLTNQMMRTVRLAVEHGITFPHGAFPLIKSLMYLDGMA